MYHPDWLVLRELSRDVADCLVRYGRGRLLDVGCGEKPYAGAAPQVREWVGVDRDLDGAADLRGDAYEVPVADADCDTVLCTQVLEHVEDPERALVEMCRVLRAGGTLILTAPQYWPLHEEPRDFFRYTTPGMRYLVEKCGFDIVEHRLQGRGIIVAGQAANNAVLDFGEERPYARAFWFKAVKAPIFLLLNALTIALAPIFSSKRDVLNHLIVARKRDR